MRLNTPATALLVAALPILWGAGSCERGPTGLGPDDAIIVAFDQSLDSWPRDGWDFLGVSLDGDHLEVEFAYAGGCRTHELRLLAVDGFEQRLASVEPDSPLPAALVPLFLAHDAHDDPCEAYITRNRRFDLAPLRAEFRRQLGDGPGRIILRVPKGQGSADSVSVDYTFD